MTAFDSLALGPLLIRPRTDGQLHEWCRRFLGHDFPRVAVCEDRGHVSPFEFLARAFFEDFTAGAEVGPRGGGKTLGLSDLHMANSIFKRGCWTCHVGAIEKQAQRARDYVARYMGHWPWSAMRDPSSTTENIVFWNGSRLEILPGTLNAVSGPRPAKATFDEVEFWKWEVYQQAINMITSQEDILGQLLLISTRQRIFGTMARIVDQAERTKSLTTSTWCIYEAMRPCPTALDPKLKGKGCALFEAKDPKTGLGRCQMRKNGEVVFRCTQAGGHIRMPDILREFSTNDAEAWETQHECSRPTRRGLVYESWDRKVHVNAERARYRPYLRTVLGIDWGYTHPCVVGFYQEEGEVLWRYHELVLQGTLIDGILDKIEEALGKFPQARTRLAWAAAGADRPENVAALRKRFKIPVNDFHADKGRKDEATGKPWGTIESGLAECRRRLKDTAGQVWYYVAPTCTFHIPEFDLYHNTEVPGIVGPDGQPLYSDVPEKENDHCVTGETWIDTCSGQVQIRDLVGRETYVWAWQDDRLVARRAHTVRRTRDGAEVVKVTFDQGVPLVLTADHRVMLMSGEWVKAGDLVSGDRVRAFFKVVGPAGHLLVKTPNAGPRAYLPAHRVVWESLQGSIGAGFLIHHRDENKLNNQPENLERLSKTAHALHHMTKRNTAAADARRGQPAWNSTGVVTRQCDNCEQDFTQKSPPCRRRTTCSRACWNALRLRNMAATKRAKLQRREHDNHVVVNVEPAGLADVYNMHVDGAEDFFANGVLVHNSMDEWRYVTSALKRRRGQRPAKEALERPRVRVEPAGPVPVEMRRGIRRLDT